MVHPSIAYALRIKLEIAHKALKEINNLSLSSHGKHPDQMVFNLGVCGGIAQKALGDLKEPIDMSSKDKEVQVHKNCGGEVKNVGEDGISYCTECEHICEGDTEYITEEQFETGYPPVGEK